MMFDSFVLCPWILRASCRTLCLFYYPFFAYPPLLSNARVYKHMFFMKVMRLYIEANIIKTDSIGIDAPSIENRHSNDTRTHGFWNRRFMLCFSLATYGRYLELLHGYLKQLLLLITGRRLYFRLYICYFLWSSSITLLMIFYQCLSLSARNESKGGESIRRQIGLPRLFLTKLLELYIIW